MVKKRDSTTPHGRSERAYLKKLNYIQKRKEWAELQDRMWQALADQERTTPAPVEPVIVYKAPPHSGIFDQDAADRLHALSLAAKEAVERMYTSSLLLSHFPTYQSKALKAVDALADLKGAIANYDQGKPQRFQVNPND